jgi:hypothetical protein
MAQNLSGRLGCSHHHLIEVPPDPLVHLLDLTQNLPDNIASPADFGDMARRSEDDEEAEDELEQQGQEGAEFEHSIGAFDE